MSDDYLDWARRVGYVGDSGSGSDARPSVVPEIPGLPGISLSDIGMGGPITHPGQTDDLVNRVSADEFAKAQAGQLDRRGAQTMPFITTPSDLAKGPDPGALQPMGSASMGAEYKGFSPDQFTKVQASTNPSLSKMDRALLDEEGRLSAPLFAQMEMARRERYNAEQAKSAADEAKITAMGHESQGMADMYAKWTAEEARINAESTAQSNQAKSAYISALADIRASRVDPSQLFTSMSKGDQIGTLASVFIHDFLGASPTHPIKTSAMDTLNKAIDRNIDAQIQQIKIKGEVAQGFKTLWDMQRAQSASDAEARARMRGIMLDQMKSQITANMAKYESGLSNAQHQEALAKIDEEAAKNNIDVFKFIDQHRLTERGQNMQYLEHQMTVAMENNRINAASKAAEAAAKQQYAERLIPDITPEGGGQAKWQLRVDPKDIGPEKFKDLLEGMGHFANVQHDMRRLQEILRETGQLQPGAEGVSKFLNSETGRQAIQLKKKIAMEIGYAKSGKNVPATEFQRIEDQMPLETWLTRGSTDAQIAQTMEGLHDEAFTNLAPFVRELREGDPGYGAQIAPAFTKEGLLPKGAPGYAAGREAEITARGQGKVEDSTVDKAINMIKPSPGQERGGETEASSKQAYAPDMQMGLIDKMKDGKDQFSPRQEWQNYNERYPGRKVNSQDWALDLAGPVGSEINRNLKTAELPDWAVGIEALRVAAVRGDKKALDKLAEIATSNGPGPSSMGGDARAGEKEQFAKYEYQQLLDYLNGTNISQPYSGAINQKSFNPYSNPVKVPDELKLKPE
jgi:hypothetical protein